MSKNDKRHAVDTSIGLGLSNIGMSKQFLCSEMIPSVAFAVKTSNCARRIVH
jgi:hypothetical protein